MKRFNENKSNISFNGTTISEFTDWLNYVLSIKSSLSSKDVHESFLGITKLITSSAAPTLTPDRVVYGGAAGDHEQDSRFVFTPNAAEGYLVMSSPSGDFESRMGGPSNAHFPVSSHHYSNIGVSSSRNEYRRSGGTAAAPTDAPNSVVPMLNRYFARLGGSDIIQGQDGFYMSDVANNTGYWTWQGLNSSYSPGGPNVVARLHSVSGVYQLPKYNAATPTQTTANTGGAYTHASTIPFFSDEGIVTEDIDFNYEVSNGLVVSSGWGVNSKSPTNTNGWNHVHAPKSGQLSTFLGVAGKSIYKIVLPINATTDRYAEAIVDIRLGNLNNLDANQSYHSYEIVTVKINAVAAPEMGIRTAMVTRYNETASSIHSESNGITRMCRVGIDTPTGNIAILIGEDGDSVGGDNGRKSIIVTDVWTTGLDAKQLNGNYVLSFENTIATSNVTVVETVDYSSAIPNIFNTNSPLTSLRTVDLRTFDLNFRRGSGGSELPIISMDASSGRVGIGASTGEAFGILHVKSQGAGDGQIIVASDETNALIMRLLNSGTFRLDNYGTANKTAVALTKTYTNGHILAPADDGTIIEVPSPVAKNIWLASVESASIVNWTLVGIETAGVIVRTGTGAINVEGIDATGRIQGDELQIHNRSANSMTFIDDGTSTATVTNKFKLPGSVNKSILQDGVATFVYNGTNWFLKSIT